MNPAISNSIPIQLLSAARNAFLFLLLPAILMESASVAAAEPVLKQESNRIGGHFRQSDHVLKSEEKLAPGVFLVADRELRDPNFYRTVVLLIRYDQDGASGVVINRPLNLKLSSVLPDFKELKNRDETLYLGGPVEQNKMLLLIKSYKQPPESLKVFTDVYVSSSREELQRLIKSTEKGEKFRIYAGYAGWAPKQLESECERGDWHVVKADTEILFDRKLSEIWQELIHRFEVNWVNLNDAKRSAVPSISLQASDFITQSAWLRTDNP